MTKPNEPAMPRNEWDNDPVTGYVQHQGCMPGLTFREYAAVAALQGLLASNVNAVIDPDGVAWAVRYADALIAKLNEEEAE